LPSYDLLSRGNRDYTELLLSGLSHPPNPSSYEQESESRSLGSPALIRTTFRAQQRFEVFLNLAVKMKMPSLAVALLCIRGAGVYAAIGPMWAIGLAPIFDTSG